MFTETDFSRPVSPPGKNRISGNPFRPKTEILPLFLRPFAQASKTIPLSSRSEARGNLMQKSIGHPESTRKSHVIGTFKYFRFRQLISFSLLNSFRGLALLSPCEPIPLFARVYRVSESIRLYISSWSVYRLDLRSVVYEFLTRDVTSL